MSLENDGHDILVFTIYNGNLKIDYHYEYEGGFVTYGEVEEFPDTKPEDDDTKGNYICEPKWGH